MKSYVRYKKDYDLIASRVIRLGGGDRGASESIGITDTTFYNWMGKHKSFRESVLKAREFCQKSSPEALRIALLEYVIRILDQGGEAVRSTSRTVTRTVQRDSSNRVQFVTDTESETESIDYKGIPKWIADKIMANSPGLNEAINRLLNSEYDVIDEEGNSLTNSVASAKYN